MGHNEIRRRKSIFSLIKFHKYLVIIHCVLESINFKPIYMPQLRTISAPFPLTKYRERSEFQFRERERWDPFLMWWKTV